ncbi:MAG: BLUF domain-containing protein [Myxococcales bacterium]|nr:BLUF domain-containing protein [Myxococcales bacterium]
MRMSRLVYCSTHRELAPFHDLQDIVTTAQNNNAANEVTGVLFYGHGTFLQAIEADLVDVAKLHDRLTRDPRHYRLQVIESEPIASRTYDRFTVAHLDGGTLLDAPVVDQTIVARHTLGDRYTPYRLTAAKANGFLHAVERHAQRSLVEVN